MPDCKLGRANATSEIAAVQVPQSHARFAVQKQSQWAKSKLLGYKADYTMEGPIGTFFAL